MSFSTDWDIDSYKADYESDEHWELRRAFMDKHKDKFAEDELVCLAQVFTNVEFLGCTYPLETMKKVAMLSEEVASDFRKLRSTKLKRTFVGASDAAEAKFKGRNQNSTNNSNNYNNHNNDNNKNYNPINKFNSKNMKTNVNIPNQHKHKMKPNKFKNFIIFEQPDDSIINTLHISADKQKTQCKYNFNETPDFKLDGKRHICRVLLFENMEIGRAKSDVSKDHCKNLAATMAINNLKQHCYTLKIRKRNDLSVLPPIYTNGKRKKTESNDIIETEADPQTTSLDKTSVAYKIMLKYGWKGGNLGSTHAQNFGFMNHEKMFKDSSEIKIGRKGIGANDNNDSKSTLDKKHYKRLFNEYVASEQTIEKLVFSSEFTKADRIFIHSLANTFQLKSISKNSDGQRLISVWKNFAMEYYVNDILNDGPSKELYELIEPLNKQ